MQSKMTDEGKNRALAFISSKIPRWKVRKEHKECSQKTIRILMKILNKEADTLFDFQNALNSGSWSNCVTVPRSYNPIQVDSRKVALHYVFCKTWRMPDLTGKEELTPVPNCQFPYHANMHKICINPFHYKKIGGPQSPAVVVPDHREYVPEYTQINFLKQFESHVPDNMTYTENGFTPSDQYADRNPVSHTPSKSSLESITPSTQYDKSSTRDGCTPESIQRDISFTKDGSTPGSLVSYNEPLYWVSIAYYEHNTRVGEIFKSHIPSVLVDGFTNPSNDCNRLSLGQLTSFNRNCTVENTKKHIGKGLHLYMEYGDVYAECLSKSPIFIQSKNLNKSHDLDPATVCKIPPGRSIKIFSNQEFAKHLAESVNYGFDAVYELIKVCTIRISFVKGWGTNYKRGDATATPCWIEIHLHGALQWLDSVLTQMGSPTNPISSSS